MSDWRVLIVEDDKQMRDSLSELIDAAGWSGVAIARANEVAARLEEVRPDVILSDVKMPGMSGMELLESLTGSGAPPIVLISAHGDIPMAVEAMQNGAYSFVEKPYEPRRLLSILSHAAEQHRMREINARLRDRLSHLSGLDRILLGKTDGIEAIRRDILDLADFDSPVFITGETGTGKELVARALHDLGARAQAPFVALNCAGLEADALAQALARASGGTLFLDEIGTADADLQAQMLRVIEGDDHGVRIVSATNEDVQDALDNSRLRSDLYHRLNVISLHLPPLRDRRDDVVLLASHFLHHAAQIYEIQPPELSQADMAALLAHDWPGNVRELRNVAERRALSARRGAGSMAQAIAKEEGIDDIPSTLREAVAVFEREMIGKAIQAHNGRMDGVAEALGIGRRTLNEKIVKLGLDKDALI